MTKETIYIKLNEIFRNVFMDDNIVLKPETHSNDIEDWDSLMQIVLLTEIEKAFAFEFDAKEVTNMQNIGDMVDIILTKLK